MLDTKSDIGRQKITEVTQRIVLHMLHEFLGRIFLYTYKIPLKFIFHQPTVTLELLGECKLLTNLDLFLAHLIGVLVRKK
jgi:hypothetical protein